MLCACGSVLFWAHDLPMVMLALCSTPWDDNGISRAEMVYGSVLALPSAFIDAWELLAPNFLQQLRLMAKSDPVVTKCSSAIQRAVWVD